MRDWTDWKQIPRIGRRKTSHGDRLEMKRLYVDECWSLTKIGKQFGLSHSTVQKTLRDLGVEMRAAHRNNT